MEKIKSLKVRTTRSQKRPNGMPTAGGALFAYAVDEEVPPRAG